MDQEPAQQAAQENQRMESIRALAALIIPASDQETYMRLVADIECDLQGLDETEATEVLTLVQRTYSCWADPTSSHMHRFGIPRQLPIYFPHEQYFRALEAAQALLSSDERPVNRHALDMFIKITGIRDILIKDKDDAISLAQFAYLAYNTMQVRPPRQEESTWKEPLEKSRDFYCQEESEPQRQAYAEYLIDTCAAYTFHRIIGGLNNGIAERNAPPWSLMIYEVHRSIGRFIGWAQRTLPGRLRDRENILWNLKNWEAVSTLQPIISEIVGLKNNSQQARKLAELFAKEALERDDSDPTFTFRTILRGAIDEWDIDLMGLHSGENWKKSRKEKDTQYSQALRTLELRLGGSFESINPYVLRSFFLIAAIREISREDEGKISKRQRIAILAHLAFRAYHTFNLPENGIPDQEWSKPLKEAMEIINRLQILRVGTSKARRLIDDVIEQTTRSYNHAPPYYFLGPLGPLQPVTHRGGHGGFDKR